VHLFGIYTLEDYHNVAAAMKTIGQQDRNHEREGLEQIFHFLLQPRL